MAGNISDQTTSLSNLTLSAGAGGLAVGGGNGIRFISAGTFAVALLAVPNASSITTAATISGLSTVDVVEINPPSGLSVGLSINAYVGAANTLVLSAANGSASTVSQAAATYRFMAIRANG